MLLDNYVKSAKQSVCELNEITKNIATNGDLKEALPNVFRKLGEALHWVGDCIERINSETLTEQEDEIFRAFMYANNQLKHDNSLYMLHIEVWSASFPTGFPYSYGPPKIVWRDFPDNGRQSSRGKRDHYNKILLNRRIDETLNCVLSIIENHI